VHIWETWETVQIWDFLGNLLCDDFPMLRMVDAGRHKINCWVPESLWEKIEALGYDNPTKATVAGYEALRACLKIQPDLTIGIGLHI